MSSAFLKGRLEHASGVPGYEFAYVNVDRPRAQSYKDGGWEVADVLVRYVLDVDGGNFVKEDTYVWMIEPSSWSRADRARLRPGILLN